MTGKRYYARFEKGRKVHKVKLSWNPNTAIAMCRSDLKRSEESIRFLGGRVGDEYPGREHQCRRCFG